LKKWEKGRRNRHIMEGVKLFIIHIHGIATITLVLLMNTNSKENINKMCV
jgi:hypothetical protein